MTSTPRVPSPRPPEVAPPAGALSAVLVRWIVDLAKQVPSVYDVQPWYLVGDGRRLDLIADPSRRLDVPDPDGRLQLLSCGAALFHIRLALLSFGRSRVSLVREPLDLPAHRTLLRQRAGIPGTVQMVLRLNLAPVAAPSPRRSLDEVRRVERPGPLTGASSS